MAFHIAETREQARAEAVDGLYRWHNEYNVWTLGRPGASHVADKWVLLDQSTGADATAAGAAEFDGSVTRLRDSQQYLHDNHGDLMAGASRAVMAKVMAHEGAAAAMGVTMERLAARRAAGGGARKQSEFRPGAGLPEPPETGME